MQAALESMSNASHGQLLLVALLKERRLQRQATMHDLVFVCSMPVCSDAQVPHLQAYVLHGEPPQARRWWLCNDSTVTVQQKDFHPSLSSEARFHACLLIYQAQKSPPMGPAPVRVSRSVAGCQTERQILNRVLTGTVHAMLGDAPCDRQSTEGASRLQHATTLVPELAGQQRGMGCSQPQCHVPAGPVQRPLPHHQGRRARAPPLDCLPSWQER